jgi:hypothetical protein
MKKLLPLILMAVVFASCSPTLTRGIQYPKMYQEMPTSILIMPPINKTVNVEAKEYFYTSLSYPLCEKGYYVVSPFLAMDVFQNESAYDSENFINGNLAPFKNVFGVDAALFTIINSWKKSDLAGTVTVDIEYILRSTKTNEILFNRQCVLTVNCSDRSTNNALINLAITTIKTATTDKVIAARNCNYFVLKDLPNGKYSNLFNKDQNVVAGKRNIKGTVKR